VRRRGGCRLSQQLTLMRAVHAERHKCHNYSSCSGMGQGVSEFVSGRA
jgi:hypothetical protein